MPSRLVIRGGNTIKGEVPASGAKNACLPVMAASILTSEPVTIGRVPDISDVWVMADILRKIGVKVDHDKNQSTLTLDASNINSVKPPEHLVSRMNASFDVAGPLLSRFGEAEVAMPGGCKIGQRRVNYHINAFQSMGADVVCEGGLVKAKAKTGRLQGGRFIFPTSSVGATANAMMAAVLAEGTSVLELCALEP
nr:UDP-N-acetylglucosamine 1-carboxyvinyltransferase [bacterium]